MVTLKELDKAGLLNGDNPTILNMTMREQLSQYDIMQTQDAAIIDFYRAGPAGIRTTQAFNQSCRWDTVDNMAADGHFSGGTLGLLIGHVSPEVAAGGVIGFIQNPNH